MSDALQDLLPALRAIPAEDVTPPSMPVDEFAVECRRVLDVVAARGLLSELAKVGINADFLEDCDTANAALVKAEADWQQVKRGRLPSDLVELEARLTGLRSRIASAARFNLEGNIRANSIVDAVNEGSGLADLALDLNVLAGLMQNNAAAFATDQTIDIAAAVDEALEGATTLRNRYAAYLGGDARDATRDLRDRAFTLAEARLSRLRRAGRYVFQHVPESAGQFANRWNANRQRRARPAGES